MDYTGEGLIEDLAVHLERELLKEGISAEEAEQKALSIAESIKKHWGGQSIYIARMMTSTFAKRDKQIIAEFNGSNHAELAHKFGISTMRVRQILWRERDRRRAKSFAMRQGSKPA